MKRLAIALLITVLSCSGAFAQIKSKKALKPLIPNYRIDTIRVVEQTPCKIRFAVSYFIKSSLSDTFFIGAYIPKESAPGNFSLLPAGRVNAGIPKGTVGFDQNVIVEVQYEGTAPLTTEQIEVVIYKSGTNLIKKTFPFRKTWKRFEIQGMKRIYTSANHVKFQVQYFIDPRYSQTCFIGAWVPNIAGRNNNFGFKPAGRLPNGVPKGQKHFGDNIVVEVLYSGATEYTSTTMELFIYNSSIPNLGSSIIRWGQTWDASVH